MAAQLPDHILIDGEKMILYSNPLESYWISSGKKRPSFYPRWDCQRGYVASWEIKGSELFLVNVEGFVPKRTLLLRRKRAKFNLKNLFPRSRQKPVKANWFSGKLRVPLGKMTQYEHSGYDSRFERDMIITIERGDILKFVTLDYSQKTLTINQ